MASVENRQDKGLAPAGGAEPVVLHPAAPAPGRDPGQRLPVDHILSVLRRRKWWVVQAVILVPLIVVLATSQQQKQYTATANLLFRDPTAGIIDGTSVTVDPTRQAATNASLVVLPAIADRAAKIMGGGVTGADIASSVSVEGGTDSDLAEISATATDPSQAARMANAYGQAYIAFRRDIDRSQLQDAITTVQDNLAALSPADRAGPEGTTQRAQLDRLLLARSLQTGDAELVQQATPPTVPSTPNHQRNLELGILLGQILGVGAAFARDRFDQSLRTPEELEALYGVPLLARVSRSRTLARDTASVEDRLTDPEAEAFRTLRANLRYFGVNGDLRSILVASPMSGDGKSTVALNLAMTMASMGDRVVLVEADLHKPGTVALNGHAGEGGLSSVLSGTPLNKALATVPVDVPQRGRQPNTRRLTVLPAGPTPPNPSELLESDRMAALLRELQEHFDKVVIDSPAFAQMSDVRPLVGWVSGVVVVSAVNHTRRSVAQEFSKQLDLLGGNVLGVVANLSPASKYGRYEYYRGS
jgi:capsular exopolysaccharide synthesis family protein